MRGWHGEPARHSLAARGVPTGNFNRIRGDPRQKILADIMILRDRSHFGDDRYHNHRIVEAIEKMKHGEEINWGEYESLRLLIEDLQNKGRISYEDILIIEETFGEELGAPLHGWNLSNVDTGNIKYTSFYIIDEMGEEIAEMKMWLLDAEGQVPDWDDDDVYDSRKEFLEIVEMVDLEEEWFSEKIENMSAVDFMRRALPFIVKLARDEGLGLEYSPLLEGGYNPELDALMGSYNFDIIDKRKIDDRPGDMPDLYSVRYQWKYRDYNPKYIIHTPEGEIPLSDINVLFRDDR